MKLKFKIIKNGIEAFQNVVSSQAEGDAWVAQSGPSFGLPDRTFTLAQLLTEGLTVEQAASQSQQPIPNGEVTVYHFPKDWSVVVEDITSSEQLQSKKATKKETRLACLELFDDVAIENETADNALMDAIFLNPSFMAIIGALVSGAPKTAKRYVQSLGPSLYSEAKVAEIVAKLDAIITASEG